MILLFIIFLTIFVFMLQKRMMKSSLDVIRENYWPEKNIVDPEETFDLVISMENIGKYYIPYVKAQLFCPKEIRVCVEDDHVTKDAERGGRFVTWSTWLRAYQEAQYRVPVSIGERGQYVLPKLRVFGGDFLGMEETSRDFSKYREIVVAPREVPESEFRELLGSFLGEHSVRRFLYEDPILTIGYREYIGREPMKMISWKQSARGNGLMVKKYDYTLEPMASVLLNVESKTDDWEQRLEQCFSLTRTVCRILEDRGIKYDFYTNAMMAGNMWSVQEVGEGLGHRHFSSVLECLGRAAYKATFSCSRLLEKATAVSEMNRARILITPGNDLTEPENYAALYRLEEISGENLFIIKASDIMFSGKPEDAT